MSNKEFVLIYAILSLPNIITISLEIYDRVKNKNKYSVRTWSGIIVICFLGTFVGIFAFMSNWFWVDKPEMWFVNMMIACYLVLTLVLIFMHNSRVVYSAEDDEVMWVARFRRKRFKISEITRINVSNEYLDVYTGEKRLRCDNLFLVGADDFKNCVKEYHSRLEKNGNNRRKL